MSSTAAPKPKIGNVTKFFIPGLALGLLIGAIGGAYYAPAVEQSMSGMDAPVKPIPTRKSAPAAPASTAATGATGATAVSGATGVTGEAPASAPK